MSDTISSKHRFWTLSTTDTRNERLLGRRPRTRSHAEGNHHCHRRVRSTTQVAPDLTVGCGSTTTGEEIAGSRLRTRRSRRTVRPVAVPPTRPWHGRRRSLRRQRSPSRRSRTRSTRRPRSAGPPSRWDGAPGDTAPSSAPRHAPRGSLVSRRTIDP